jgi:GNAT superfamily N-acetyltransferase
MDEGALKARLWDGFARLQTLLGGQAGHGHVVEDDGLVASVVPGAPESPTLNAAVAIEPEKAPGFLEALADRYAMANVKRWGVWLDAAATEATWAFMRAGMVVTTASPGMGAGIDDVLDGNEAMPNRADLATVGRVNDLAYGNPDHRLERTLSPLTTRLLHAYKAELVDGTAAAVAMAMHHNHDCGVSFVATIPKARRKGLATDVMHQALAHAKTNGCTSTTLQATDVGERLYERLGYRRLCLMQLWEHRR